MLRARNAVKMVFPFLFHFKQNFEIRRVYNDDISTDLMVPTHFRNQSKFLPNFFFVLVCGLSFFVTLETSSIFPDTPFKSSKITLFLLLA